MAAGPQGGGGGSWAASSVKEKCLILIVRYIAEKTCLYCRVKLLTNSIIRNSIGQAFSFRSFENYLVII